MPIAGIIAEFNPLHNGHKYLIEKAKNDGNYVICIISGNFVQRGDVAIISKEQRTKSALLCGADLVLELPVPWSMSTAQNFALGGVSQLSAFNIDSLYFGSECGNAELLIKTSDILLSSEYNAKLKEKIKTNKSFATIRQEILAEYSDDLSKILDNPNDSLAVEYICAAKKLGLNITFNAVKRVGAGHNDLTDNDSFCSSTMLREKLKQNDINNIENLVPEEAYNILINAPHADIKRLDTAIISRLKMLSSADIETVPDISEGLGSLLLNSVKESYTYSELCDKIKSKRYTMARIRRIVLSAFLGIDKKYFLTEPPYVRVLGFNENGSKLIPKVRKKPIITKVSQLNSLSNEERMLFETENKISEIYALSLDAPADFTSEYKRKIIKI